MVAYRAETGLLSSWQERGPKLAWKIKGLGNGLSSIAVTEGCIYRIGKRDGAIKMIALNSKDGAKTWESDISSEANEGPNSTPVVDGPCVCSLTHAGQLVCAIQLMARFCGGSICRLISKVRWDSVGLFRVFYRRR